MTTRPESMKTSKNHSNPRKNERWEPPGQTNKNNPPKKSQSQIRGNSLLLFQQKLEKIRPGHLEITLNAGRRPPAARTRDRWSQRSVGRVNVSRCSEAVGLMTGGKLPR